MSSGQKQEFVQNIVLFLEELIEQIPEMTTQLLFAKLSVQQMEPDFIINNFIQHILPHEEEIRARNDVFFFEHARNMFGGKVNYFNEIWNSSALDAEDRQTVWDWFDMFVLASKAFTR